MYFYMHVTALLEYHNLKGGRTMHYSQCPVLVGAVRIMHKGTGKYTMARYISSLYEPRGRCNPFVTFPPLHSQWIYHDTQTFSAEFSATKVVHMHMINKVCGADGDSKE